MIIRVVDLETDGFEASNEVLEIGYYDLLDGKMDLTTGRKLLVRPARPISPVASAVHHITDADVADAPPWADAWRILVETRDDGEELKFAAHMAQFERQWLDKLIKADWICTWKCSFRQWPDLESHGLQAIRYALALSAESTLAMPPHRALPDAYVCGLLLLELLKHQTVETLVAWSSEPAVFTKFDFGEHTGKPLSEVRASYFEWMLTRDFSEDWKWNAQRELDRRAGAAAAKVIADRQLYLEHSLAALPGAASVRDLENWFIGQADPFAAHGILVGTEEYIRLIAACAARKAALLESGQPQFSTPARETSS
jgi:exodeoxyribonuclease X